MIKYFLFSIKYYEKQTSRGLKMDNFMAVMNSHVTDLVEKNKEVAQESCNYQDNYYGDRLCKGTQKSSVTKSTRSLF